MNPRLAFNASALLGLAAWALSAFAARAGTNFSFVSASDTHFADPDEKNDRERAILASVNTVTERTLGGIPVRSLRGVLNPGDLIDTGLAAQWSYWSRDFGLTGGDGAVLKYPVYEDFGGTGHDGAAMPGNITTRNALRFGLTAFSGYNYSWDWNGIHFVTAGIRGGDLATDADRVFLANDLATHVGSSGRPVVVMEHEDANNLAQSLYDEVLKNYNTILIVDGHESGGSPLWNNIQTLSGNGFLSGYWLVQISGNTLKAGRTTGGSGNLAAAVTRSITFPACIASITGADDGSWDRPARWSGGVTPQHAGDYASLDGTTPATLTLDGPRTLSGLNLDTTASTGYTLVPGSSAGSLTLQKTAGAVSVSAIGNHAIAAPITLASPAAVWVSPNSQLDLSGTISGTNQGLTKAGAGTLVLAASNSHTGPTTAAGGMLRLAQPGSLPGGLGVSGGTSGLTLNGGMIELTDTDFFRALGTGSHQVQFIGPGGFSCLGTTGDRAVNLGHGAAQVTWGVGSFVPAGATLRLGSTSGALRFANPINLGSANRTIEVPSGTARLDGGVVGTGGLTKTGTGTLMLPLACTYSGTSTILQGTLQLGAADVSGSANDFTLVGTITGAGALVKAGDTTITLNSANSHVGGTSVTGGTLRLGHAGALGFGAPIAKGNSLPGTTVSATLDLNGRTLGGNFILAGGSLVNHSSSPATLTTLAGLTTSSGGTTVPVGATITVSGGGGAGATATPTFGLTTASFIFTNIGRDYVVGDVLYITGGGGSGARFKITSLGASSGVGTLSLLDPGSGYTSAPTGVVGGGSGRNATITGNADNFQVVALSVTAPGSNYTSPPTVSLSGGTGFAATAVLSSVVLTAPGSIGGAGNLMIAAPITGDFGLTKIGGGTTTLTGSNSYTGATTVAAGTLALTTACLADPADVLLSAGATLHLNTGTTDTIHALFIDGEPQAAGEWGPANSDAAHKSMLITGSGKLNVSVGGDTTPPVVTAPANVTVEATSAAGAVVTYPAATATDAVGVTSITYSQASGSTFPLGTTTVTVTAKDAANNSGTATFTVTVEDNTAPMVTPPSDLTAEATSAAGALVTYPAATATDAVGVTSITYSQASGSTFPLGSTTVTVMAKDAANNSGTATFTVTVRDSPFTAWIAGFSVGALTGPSDDPDGDGQPNLLEFALNSSPADGTAQGKVFVTLTTIGTSPKVLTLTAATRSAAFFAAAGNNQQATVAADHLTYHIEAATTLADWSTPPVTEVTGPAATALQSGLPVPAPGWTYHSFRTAGEAAVNTRDFIRVKVTSP
ncbi:MAG: HYR domain-containing protein [Verrucomicrobia bacterium]|nr:HYR domain-containing protein [Verrucomicrobiota bacterium]